MHMNAWSARPARVHPMTIFRLALSNKCKQAFLKPDCSVHPCGFRCAVIVYQAFLAGQQIFLELREYAYTVRTNFR